MASGRLIALWMADDMSLARNEPFFDISFDEGMQK
jgi:hypothetical protein